MDKITTEEEREKQREYLRRSRQKHGQPQSIAIYLGSGIIAEQRKIGLDQIAARLNTRDKNGNPSRSTLIQMIADGDLLVVTPEQQKTPSS